MDVLAWTALFAPAVAVVVIALMGERITRFGAGVIATAAPNTDGQESRPRAKTWTGWR